jgi:hypothetical protein
MSFRGPLARHAAGSASVSSRPAVAMEGPEELRAALKESMSAARALSPLREEALRTQRTAWANERKSGWHREFE